MRIGGHYFAYGSARFIDAVAFLSEDGTSLCVVARDGGTLIDAPLRDIRTSSRLGTLKRKLHFPDGGCFETADNDSVDILLRGSSDFLHRLESNWSILLAAILVIAAATAWFALFGVPLTAGWLARHTPDSVSRYMTQQALATLEGRVLKSTKLSAAQQRRFDALFAGIAASEGRGPGHYRLLLRNAPLIGPNAFAFPDGTIVMTDQIAPLIHKDAEIEGVFAHEMAHVNRAHGLQRVYQASLVPAAIAFITGDVSQVSHAAAILPGVLLQSAYSRAFEQQADDDAAALLRRRGEDPGALADLLERMDRQVCGKGGCGPSWLGSHPATALRAARLRRAPAQ